MIKKEGEGWRIIRDESRDHFPTLIGGQNWAIELTELEWLSLGPIVFDLSNQYIQIKDQLMGDEDITIELDRNPWLAILNGDKYGWSLKLILSQTDQFNRGAEIFWPRDVAKRFSEAMRSMWDSCYL